MADDGGLARRGRISAKNSVPIDIHCERVEMNMGIEQLGAALKPINPSGRNPEGGCAAMAREVADVLTLNKTPVNQSENTEGSFAGLTEVHRVEEKKKGAEIWQWMVQNMSLNGVYGLDDDDHSWNMVRDAKGTLYIVDVASFTFKPVSSMEEYTITFRGEDEVLGGGEDEAVTLNMLKKYQPVLTIDFAGPLSPQYQIMLNT
jgi:hypothetical protein